MNNYTLSSLFVTIIAAVTIANMISGVVILAGLLLLDKLMETPL